MNVLSWRNTDGQNLYPWCRLERFNGIDGYTVLGLVFVKNEFLVEDIAQRITAYTQNISGIYVEADVTEQHG